MRAFRKYDNQKNVIKIQKYKEFILKYIKNSYLLFIICFILSVSKYNSKLSSLTDYFDICIFRIQAFRCWSHLFL